ncbi:MAG: hypothetical protein HKN47_16905 [Pirellulaceae bacterium]|nr:hypothetical protein [Pirellulaceae bacterium]
MSDQKIDTNHPTTADPIETADAHENTKLIVLVVRHLALESSLATEIAAWNQATTEILTHAGVRGPTDENVAALGPITAKLQDHAATVGKARQVLLRRINGNSQTVYNNIRDFIVSLSPSDRRNLDDLRRDVLNQTTQASSGLIQNQASLYYTHEFHRKYLAGVLQTDLDGHSYRADGQTQDVTPGNIFGKTC